MSIISSRIRMSSSKTATASTTRTTTSTEDSPLLLALKDRRISAEVVDLDHYRMRGGMAVETDYIISVKPTSGPKNPTKNPQIESFTLSKSYSAFRTLGHQLKKAADAVMMSDDDVLPPKSVQKLAQYCESVVHLVEAQRTQYLGKVNYNYVKVLAKKRSLILNEVLEMTLNHFPEDIHVHPFHEEVANTIETFFLCDHCIMEPEAEAGHNDNDNKSNHKGKGHHHRISSSGGSLVKHYRASDEDAINRLSPKSSSRKTAGSKIPAGLDPFGIEKGLDKVVKDVGHTIKKGIDTVSGKDNNSDNNPKKRELQVDTAGASAKSRPTLLTSPVVPLTRKSRRSITCRANDDSELTTVGEDANLLLDDDRTQSELVPSYSHPVPTFRSRGKKLGDLLENNPIVFAMIGAVSIYALRHAANLTVTIDLDIMLLLLWACFCVGLHTPRPMVGGIDKSSRPVPPGSLTRRRSVMKKLDYNGRALLRMSMISPMHSTRSITSTRDLRDSGSGASTHFLLDEEDDEYEDDIMDDRSPLPQFPKGAKLGSELNCWSAPDHDRFHVRGAKYLKDHKKIPSADFVFPIRAIDLFLTDACPQNAGRIPGVLGGKLREKPTFLINFRLPWGILLAYWEIPDRFIPFVRAGHEVGFDASDLPSLDSMSNEDRCVARFLQGSEEHKNAVLKIVPVIAEGPWVVKSIVTGKPALIGTKMPVSYFYSKAENGKELYLEADLDIVASSAARGILSAVRAYTQVLTIDLGFVVQGNAEDELPEQMLVGCRLHGIDPLSAPPLPPCKDMFLHHESSGAGDDDASS